MDSEQRVAFAAIKIHGANAERVFRNAAGHAISPFLQLRLALNHFRRRRPGRVHHLAANAGNAGPGEAFFANGNTIAHRLAAVKDEIERALIGFDDDRARFFRCAEAHRGATAITAAFLGLGNTLFAGLWLASHPAAAATQPARGGI